MMNIFRALPRFLRERGGSLSIMMGFIFLTIASAVGGAVDLSNGMRQRAIAQRDLDAALLTVIRNPDSEDMTNAERGASIRAFLTRTFDDFPAGAVIVVSKEEDTYFARLEFNSKNAILQIVGYDNFPISVESSVTLGPPRPMELALVLDTTASMNFGNKLETMQEAARDLVTTLTEGGTTRIALVPFSRHINIGMANRSASGLDIPHDEPDRQQCSTSEDQEATNCRDEQQTCSNSTCSQVSSTCTSDGVSYSCTRQQCRTTSTYQCTQNVCDYVGTGTYSTSCSIVEGDKWRGCVGSREHPHNTRDTIAGGLIPGFLEGNCAQPIVRLTSDGPSIVSTIDSLNATNETYIAPGLLWGARLISSTAPFPDGTPVSSDEDMQKVIVLMSDGVNTVSKTTGQSRHTGTDETDSNDLLLEVCKNLKEQGITIYTVAYDIHNLSGRNLLNDCASDESFHFYDARTDRQLIDSFESITRGLQTVRVSQ